MRLNASGCAWCWRRTTPRSWPSCRRCSRRCRWSWWRRASSASPRPRSRTSPSSRTRWPRRAMRRAPAAGRRSPTTRACASTRSGGAPGVVSAHYAQRRAAAEASARRSAAGRTPPTTRCCCSACTASTDRRARFVSTLVALRSADDPQPLVAVGRWQGEILDAAARRGRLRLRPADVHPGARRHRGRAAARAKNAHSHRALAAGRCCS